MGQGIGNMLGGSGEGGGIGGGIQSLVSGLGGLNRDYELVKHVQHKAGGQDPERARQYTQQGVEILSEQSRDNSQGLPSLLGSFMGSGGAGDKQNKGSGGGLGGMMGDILGGYPLPHTHSL
jgi:hypothetical protein